MLAIMAVAAVLPAIVTVEGRDVTLGDLLGAARAGAGAARVVVRLPVGRTSVVLPAEAVRALIRRQFPALAVSGSGSVAIQRRAVIPSRGDCWASIRAMVAGDIVARRDVVAAPCPEKAVAAIVVADRTDRAPRMRGDQPAGAMLGRFLPAPDDRVASGTALTLRAVQGPVVIERAVTTLQPARGGRRVFVRDGAGHVFAAPLAVREDGR